MSVSEHTVLPLGSGGYRTPDTGAVLKTIANPNPSMRMRQEHLIKLPELCPASHNPGPGSTLRIRYRGKGQLLEVFSLGAYIRAFIAHPVVSDVELLTQTVARDCAAAVGQKVQVEGRFELPSIRQCVVTRVQAK